MLDEWSVSLFVSSVPAPVPHSHIIRFGLRYRYHNWVSLCTYELHLLLFGEEVMRQENFVTFTQNSKISSCRYIEYGQLRRREAQKHSRNKFPLFSGSSDMLECYKWQEIIHRHTSFAKYLSICGVGTAVISRYLVSASVNVQPAGSRLNGFHVIVPFCFPTNGNNWFKSCYRLRFKSNL